MTAVPPAAWTRDHVRGIAPPAGDALPVIRAEEVAAMVPGLDFWDPWPVRTPDNRVAVVAGGQVWAALSAPAVGHPGGRHAVARIRLLHHVGGTWIDLGPLFPDGASPGSREWAGSCVLDGDELHAYYTAAGVRGEARPTFRQRIFHAVGRLDVVDGRPRVGGWGPHGEAIRADGRWYAPADQAEGEPGFILAFRDPYVLADRSGGPDLMLFTASLASTRTPFCGAIGLARRDDDGRWRLEPPLVTADGVNNELERPHVRVHGGRSYVLFSTQARTFDPAVTGPTGLYGFVGTAVTGPLTPVNGTGLVLRNPQEEPYQAYSWLVLDDLSVRGFVDSFNLEGLHPDELEAFGADRVRQHFGGTITAPAQLVLEGERAYLRAP